MYYCTQSSHAFSECELLYELHGLRHDSPRDSYTCMSDLYELVYGTYTCLPGVSNEIQLFRTCLPQLINKS